MTRNKNNKLDNILSLVDEYIKEKNAAKKWTPGEDWVHYAGSYYDSSEYINAVRSLLGGWLALADDGLRFERKFPKFLGKENGILTNSGSSANLLMMSAIATKRLYNFPKGTKVLTPVAGFPTTVNPIFQVGFEPVFVDVELPSMNLNLDQVEKKIKEHDIKVITFAHVLGNPPNMNRLMDIIEKNNLILLEDCCDALGSSYDGQPLGSFGKMSSCSFYPAHHITLGEGGFVATPDDEHERVVRSLRDWGRGCYCVGKKATMLKNGTCKKRFSNWLPTLPNEIFDHKYVYEEIGYNLKPIEIQAAIGLVQINKIEEITRRRKENFRNLYKVFEKYGDLFHLPEADSKADPSWFAFPLTIKDNTLLKRDVFTRFLEANKIQTRTYFGGNFLLQPAYSHLSNPQEVVKEFPVATKITTDTFFLGTSPVITKEQINYIGDVVDKYMKTSIKRSLNVINCYPNL